MTENAHISNYTASLRGAAIASVAFVLAFAGAALPVPLYAEYQASIGITDIDIALTMVFYLSGVVIVLVAASRLSDALGRRPLVAAELALTALGCMMLVDVGGAPDLLFTRFVQGASCGIAMSATSAFVIDLCSLRYRTLAVTVASSGALVGTTIGSLCIGALAQAAPDVRPVFAGAAALCGACLLLLPFAPETSARHLTLPQSLRPRLTLPAGLRPLFPLVAGVYVAAWGIGTFFQSLGTPAVVVYFGTENPLVPALLIAATMLPSALGGPIEAKLPCKTSVILGVSLLFGTSAGLVATLAAGLALPFFGFALLFGVAVGICLSASIHLAVEAGGYGTNATVVSIVNLAGYLGCTVLNVAMSALAGFLLPASVLLFVVVGGGAALAIGAAMTARRRKSAPARSFS